MRNKMKQEQGQVVLRIKSIDKLGKSQIETQAIKQNEQTDKKTGMQK